MSRHFHNSGRGHSRQSSFEGSLSSISHGALEVSFSPAFRAAVDPKMIKCLQEKGFECDVDLRHLKADELVSGMQGLLVIEEAADLIQLAKATINVLPNVGSAARSIPCPKASLTVEASIAAQNVKPFSRSLIDVSAARQKRPRLISDDPFEFLWSVYIELGPQGLLWSPLAGADPDAAKIGLQRRLKEFEPKTLNSKISMNVK